MLRCAADLRSSEIVGLNVNKQKEKNAHYWEENIHEKANIKEPNQCVLNVKILTKRRQKTTTTTTNIHSTT